MNAFIDLAKNRYSVRQFKNKPVSDDDIQKIIEAGRVAPTACNNQPAKIYLVKSAEAMAKLNEVCPCIYGAPIAFVIAYDPGIAAKAGYARPKGYGFGETDAAIVCTHMMLEAADLGLGSCWVGYFKDFEVKEALGIPEDFVVANILPVGYEADGYVANEMHSTIRSKEEVVVEL